MFEDSLIAWVLAIPQVKALAVFAATWAVGGKAIAFALYTVAVAIRPFVLLTPTKADDKWLEIAIYWLDAVGDLFDPLALFRYRKAIEVWNRIKEDMGKPYSDRRTD